MAPFRTGFVTSFYSSTLERKKGSWFVLILSWGVVYVFQRLKDASYKPPAISMSLLCGLFIFFCHCSRLTNKTHRVVYHDEYLLLENTNIHQNLYNL